MPQHTSVLLRCKAARKAHNSPSLRCSCFFSPATLLSHSLLLLSNKPSTCRSNYTNNSQIKNTKANTLISSQTAYLLNFWFTRRQQRCVDSINQFLRHSRCVFSLLSDVATCLLSDVLILSDVLKGTMT